MNWPADNLERWPIEKLTPYARNTRTHTPAQIDAIAASIKEWGWTMPVLADEDGTLIAGHARIQAAQKLGIAEVPVMLAKGWPEAKRRAYVIADNQLAIKGSGWDFELLASEIEGLGDEGFDLSLLGFDLKELAALIDDAAAAGEITDGGGINYQSQFGVIVTCKDETDQEKTYNRLDELGYECKVVTT